MPAFGQAVGDYRSSGSGTGNWIDPATWQTFDGSDWNTAIDSSTRIHPGTISIRTGHTVTVTSGNPDTIKGAAIVVDGYLKDQAYLNFTPAR